MALTAYCKKCGREVDAGEVCPICGTRLGKNSGHAVWCLEVTPVRDWMSWNGVMRILLPAGAAALGLILLLEGISGGMEAVERLLASGLLTTLAILLGTAAGIVLLILLMQGTELADYAVDNRGIHETRYLPNPTALKLLARMKSPGLMAEAQGEVPVVKLGEKSIAWKDVARVQLWPEKCMALIYAPAWWMRIALVCTPFTWEDTMGLIRNKLGKKKKVLLPPSLVIPPAPKTKAKPRARVAPEVEEAIEQIRMEEVMEAEETP